MKAITINVSDAIYSDFTRESKKMNRSAADLIRQAMNEFHGKHLLGRTSLRNRHPASSGGTVQPLTGNDDILGEMLHES